MSLCDKIPQQPLIGHSQRWDDDTLNVRTNLKSSGEKKWQKRRMTWCHSVCPSCLFRRGHARNTAMSSCADVQFGFATAMVQLPACTGADFALPHFWPSSRCGGMPNAEDVLISFEGPKNPNGKWRKTENDLKLVNVCLSDSSKSWTHIPFFLFRVITPKQLSTRGEWSQRAQTIEPCLCRRLKAHRLVWILVDVHSKIHMMYINIMIYIYILW